MSRLWLVRHARPLIAPGTCYGRLDVPADPAHTLEVAAEMASLLPRGTLMRSSPRQRCAKLALTLREARPDLQTTPTALQDGRLAEMDFGHWEGQAWDALPAPALQAWTDDFLDHPPGGGESVRRFMARVRQALDEARQTGPSDTDQLWITHAGVIRAVQWMMRDDGLPQQASDWPRSTLAYGGRELVRLD